MALRKKRGQEYGESQADIREYLLGYGKSIGNVPDQFADAKCACGNSRFGLVLDDDQGAALRACTACKAVHAIADSAEYVSEATLEGCACPCGAEAFEITVGVALYVDSEDVRWLYVGARCPKCGLVGCYGDWKNEFIGYKELLARV